MMNREEMIERVAKWWEWPKPDALPDSLPHAPADWEWVNDKVGATGKALFNPSYGMITVNDWQDARNGVVVSTPTPNKYQCTVPSTTIDVYDVLHAYNVTNPATQHAVKKLLQPGNRGHKDTLTDLREALASIQRAIQIEEQSCQP